MRNMAEIVFFGGGRRKGEEYVKYNSLYLNKTMLILVKFAIIEFN